jgi:hypothetical protein
MGVNGFCCSKPDCCSKLDWVLTIQNQAKNQAIEQAYLPHVDDLELTSSFFLLCLGMNPWSELN